ncbi:ethylmalonyl-CoA decarboxylase [Lepeophtheirus salmonis]|uniref:ethylmalonyl-CoA decarboxylase n=1 Tax=Lepeophtheirus salmonis TaxID=72036 RepID=UPI001AE4ABB2|nr:ethylmalonyl-CoA decarboxylase-like [Lepeophtheirus salmonis]
MLKNIAKGIGNPIRTFSASTTPNIQAIKSQFKGYEKYGSTRLEIHGELAKIIFDHPEKKNAMTSNMMVELHDALLQLENIVSQTPNTLRSLLVTSKGDFFCAGGDKRFVQHIFSPENGMMMASFMNETANRINELPLISATFVQGGALGGGAELCLWTDFLLLHRTTGRIGFVQSKMGLLPGWGSGHKLVRQIGPRYASRLLLLGEILNAEKALQIDLASDLVESEEEAVDWLKEKSAHLSPHIIKQIKKLVHCSNLENAMDVEKELFGSVWSGPAHLAAVEKNIKHRK